MLCCEQGKKLSYFGIKWPCNSLISFDQFALCTYGLDLLLLNYWRSIHKENFEVF